MTTNVYKNEDENAVSIRFENQRIDVCIPKGEKKLIIELYEDGVGEAVKGITLPLLPGIGALGPFFSDAQVLLDMINIKPVGEPQEA